MCVLNGTLPWPQRLVGFVPVLSYVAMAYCRPGLWRHVCVVTEMVVLGVVIVSLFINGRRGRERRY